MSGHTPGPWKASAPDGDYHDVIRVWADSVDDRPVAICPQMYSPIIAVLLQDKNDTTQTAFNARLIAAAPALLTELREATRLMVNHQSDEYGPRENWPARKQIERQEAAIAATEPKP